MIKRTRIKFYICFIIFLFIPLAVFLDYLYFGYKSVSGYYITCLFEICLFFCGITFGEWLERQYRDKK